MRKIFSLLVLFSIFISFSTLNEVKAQESCTAKLVVHYHRYNDDYDNYELYTWDYDATGGSKTIAPSSTDAFGGVFEINICSGANDQIGVILKEKDTWNKDGVDANKDNDIDNKFVNVSDLRGTSNTMHVYVMQGAADVYYQDPLKATYFGKPGFGNVVVVYYNPGGNEGWDDFWTWGTGTGAKSDDIIYDYNLGLSGGIEPNLFKVGVINIANDADDQIGFIARKDKSWDTKDDNWVNELEADETDEFGHTYQKSGNRLINVTDVKGSGFKFIFVIYGNKTLYEDFDAFKAEAFKLEFTQAEFRSTKALKVTLNQEISYGETGPDITSFQIEDQDGNIIPIDRITFDSLKTSDKTFNIIMQNDIEQGKNYKVTYTFEQFGVQKTAQTQATIAEGVFADDPIEDVVTDVNYMPYLITGIVLVVAIGAGIIFLNNRKK
ncbi:hypothetical protein KHQ81_04500 [Mycoplasmatota bacterium]|nr:hypothetical protein KHQ81_04500 [Mycoplasmatota bacterium]